MTRIKRGVQANKKRKNILKKTKGYKYGRKNKVRLAKNAWIKAKTYAYRDRRTKKRNMRSLWNIKINAGARENGISYSKLINGLKKNKIELDRKILATLAENDKQSFKAVVEAVK